MSGLDLIFLLLFFLPTLVLQILLPFSGFELNAKTTIIQLDVLKKITRIAIKNVAF